MILAWISRVQHLAITRGRIGCGLYVEWMCEGRELETKFYGPEYLLLTLLRDAAGLRAQVIARHGVGFEDARADVRRVLFSSPDASPTPPTGQRIVEADGSAIVVAPLAPRWLISGPSLTLALARTRSRGHGFPVSEWMALYAPS